jgi:hypothetical protein
MKERKKNMLQSEICVLVGLKASLVNGQHAGFINVPHNISPYLEKELLQINSQCTQNVIEAVQQLIESKRCEANLQV